MGWGHERPTLEALWRRLSERGFDTDRYALGDELGKGGMGEVLQAHDDLLDRSVAIKVSRRAGEPLDRYCGRFLDEARITGQLDHPGIVPVHELGVRDDGRPFYTMKLVRGRTLAALLDDPGGWPLPRRVGVLLKVGEAMAYAHAKGVIHRDLKPANIMVGKFGEVYVMDWGLARIRTQLVAESVAEGASQTVEVEASLRTPDSDLLTGHGTAVGTPAYMSPEQARGRLDELGPASDVYAVGAMLYELLRGRPPYHSEGETPRGRDLLQRVLVGPPASLSRVAPRADPELVAVCERAMAREVSARFPDMAALVEQLRAWLEGRVVSAHRTGPWVEFVKWCRRNRAAAALTGALLVVLSTAGFVVADRERARAEEAEARAALEGRELRRHRAEELVRRADTLWPASAGAVDAIDRWSADVHALLDELGTLDAELASLRASGTPVDDWPPPDPVTVAVERRHVQRARVVLDEYGAQLAAGDVDARHAEVLARSVALVEVDLPRREGRLRRLDAARERMRPYGFPRVEDRQAHDTLARLLEAREALAGDEGLLARVARRRVQAMQLAEPGDGGAVGWDEALASIADPASCPAYAGLHLLPQAGLQPLRRNPDTGLWEFLHTPSGDAPEPGPDGRWIVRPETGVVLVLVPGGESLLGAQATDAAAPAFDPRALAQDGPPRSVALRPFFLAAHELTQAQWARLAGDWPAQHYVGDWNEQGPYLSPPVSETAPVELVSWTRATEVLASVGLVLPTEAQWSHAARGDDDRIHPWCARGEVPDGPRVPSGTLREVVLTRLDAGFEMQALRQGLQDPALGDGFLTLAPVGSFPPNPYGLHDLGGNVAEWCADEYASDFGPTQVQSLAHGDGRVRAVEPGLRPWKGGSFALDPFTETRVASRHGLPPDDRAGDLGLRAARALED